MSIKPAKELSRTKSFDCTILRYSHLSPTLGNLTANFSIILPPPSNVTPHTLLYLSGLTCTDQNFITKAGAARPCRLHNIAIIAPDTSPRGANIPGEDDDWDIGTGAGFYIDATTEGWKKYYRMESYITKELLEVVKATVGEEKMRFEEGCVGIMGHSMGGFGALMLGLRYRELFGSVSAFSPIANPVNCPWGKKAFKTYLGEDEKVWRGYDPTVLVGEEGRKVKGEGVILIDQGDADGFWKEGQLLGDSFERACKKGGQKVEMRMREGYDHSYHFIATFIDDHIEHHAKILRS